MHEQPRLTRYNQNINPPAPFNLLPVHNTKHAHAFKPLGRYGFAQSLPSLCATTHLVKIDCSENGLRGNVTAFALVLGRADSTLEELVLAENGISDSGAQELAESLKRNSRLALLDLKGNSVGDKGGIEIAEALRTNPSLKTLDLAGNPIWAAGASALASALRDNNVLVGLRIDGLEAAVLQGQRNSAESNRKLTRKEKLKIVSQHEYARDRASPTRAGRGAASKDLSKQTNVPTAAALLIAAELQTNLQPLSEAAKDKLLRIQNRNPCAGQTSRLLCHSRGYPAARTHASEYEHTTENGTCTCAPCMPGFAGVYCELVDVCMPHTTENLCHGRGVPVIAKDDNGDHVCKCSPCFESQDLHDGGYHGNTCEKRKCVASNIFEISDKGKRKSKEITIPPDCTELFLDDVGLQATECADLVEALRNQPNKITRLSLKSNSIGKAGAASIGKLLATSTAIAHIDLQRSSVYNAGAAALLEGLERNTAVTSLGLELNSVDDEALLESINAEVQINNNPDLLEEKKGILRQLQQACLGKSAAVLCNGNGVLVPISDPGGAFCGCTDCSPAFSGDFCEVHTPCFKDKATGANWCKNHGVPKKSQDGKACSCPTCDDGFTGKQCELQNPCFAKTKEKFCNNHGFPLVVTSKITGALRCECNECDRGFSGARCSVFDPCFSKTSINWCFNHGTPVPDHLSGQDCTCACTSGYSGPRCDQASFCQAGTAEHADACVESCPAGMFANSARKCEQCDKNCKNCTGHGPSSCIECSRFHRQEEHQIVCVEACEKDEVLLDQVSPFQIPQLYGPSTIILELTLQRSFMRKQLHCGSWLPCLRRKC